MSGGGMNINVFCADDFEVRDYLKKPFNYKGQKVCTNGHICVISRLEQEDIDDTPKQILKGTSIFDSIINFAVPPKKVTVGSIDEQTYLCYRCKGTGVKSRCDECDGDGVVCFTTDYNDYECECKGCDGEGVDAICRACRGKKLAGLGKNGYQWFPVGEAFVDPGYVKLILDNLGPVDFYPAGKGDMVLFEAGGCKGGLMPVRV